MRLSLQPDQLAQYVAAQMAHFFPDGARTPSIEAYLGDTLDRVRKCFAAVNNKYFRQGGEVRFHHLHSDQYAMFLYFLANTIYRRGGDPDLCTKLYYLNKSLHGIDAYYEISLPDIFLFSHSVGTVLGRAVYGDYFLVNQHSTIGAAREALPGQPAPYPVLGRYVAVYAGASVLGACRIGDNCKISAHSVLFEQDLEPGTIYIGTRDAHLLKRNRAPDHIWNEN